MEEQEHKQYYDDTQEAFDNLARLVRDVREQTWREDSACWGSQLEDFFPKRGESTAKAKKICGACAVQAECGEFATFTTPLSDAQDGIWGGLSRNERQTIRKTAAHEEDQKQEERRAS